jgi:hypothetical protein
MSHLMSLLGVKRTWPIAVHMSAFDPKRTLSGGPLRLTLMEIGKRTIDCSFYNHLPKVRAPGDRADANRRLSVFL